MSSRLEQMPSHPNVVSASRLHSVLTYGFFMLAVVAVGVFIGTQTTPGAWYQSLAKPSFTPPNWLFGPVWTTLYLIIGWVGARAWLTRGDRGVWGLQMVLNFAWSPVFFGLQAPREALAIIAALLATVVLFIIRQWKRDPLSAKLFIPYAAWLMLATSLNVGIVTMNQL